MSEKNYVRLEIALKRRCKGSHFYSESGRINRDKVHQNGDKIKFMERSI
jgi:hypothetical protein